MTKILQILYNHQDEKYGDFMAKLVPTVARERFIGVRSPEYKKVLKEVKATAADEVAPFMQSLPHEFHEENILHVVLLKQIKDFDECVRAVELFLPYVNNWAVSDGLNPPCFAKNREKLLTKCREWIAADAPYTKRVGIQLLMGHFLTDAFKAEYLELVAPIRSDEYYVNMMIAWFFAEALAKQWESAVPFIEQKRLAPWTHNKAIQKARESLKITAEQKEYLKTLKVAVKETAAARK